MKIFVKAQACTKPHSHTRESEDLDVLGDIENFTIISTRTSPIGESEDLSFCKI